MQNPFEKAGLSFKHKICEKSYILYYIKNQIMKNTVSSIWVIIIVTLLLSCKKNTPKYEAAFPSLETSNPVPEWFKDAKFGIYFHWGVYSVPAFGNEWYPRNMYIKGSNENIHHFETYGDPEQWPYDKFITGASDKKNNFIQFAPRLKSEGGKFDPDEWAQLFADAGAKFAGPVAEHHDGFSMWASDINPWNAKDMGPRLDLVSLLTDAIRKKDMKVILSMHHAYNITGYYDAVPKHDDPKLQKLYGQQGKDKNEAYWLAKHKEIIDHYKPDIIWQDFNLSAISEPVLLQFLAYYYNSAAAWNKEVVATYKDALNTKCAVLDYERGGPTDITENYWLTDDAISSSSWCYTDGIGYYSKKQILHGFIDRISKNGNLLLNISPMADGTIPEEQKEILLSMGDWLKKYGEAVYATRAWEKYGEGPTKMGAAHGVFTAPSEGTPKDIRYTRSKDSTTLYAILLGWDKGQKELKLTALSSNRINCSTLNSVQLICSKAGNYQSLSFRQDTTGLIVDLPERTFEDLAYALKLNFNKKIPVWNKYVDLNCQPHYYLIPGDNKENLVLGQDLRLTSDRKVLESQWHLENKDKGFYAISNRGNKSKVLVCSLSDKGETSLVMNEFSGKDDQLWKVESSYMGLLKISSKQYPNVQLSIPGGIKVGVQAEISVLENAPDFGWILKEVCEMKRTPYKSLSIPGTVEAEDFDKGCPDETYCDKDENNAGGQYRPEDGIDIQACKVGGYNIGWVKTGEWMEYTVHIKNSGNYLLTAYVATENDNGKMHIEFDGIDKTGIMAAMNTGGYQNWKTISKQVQLDTGNHIMKIYFDDAPSGLNLDKITFILK
jgi:alpha-L-fucosidase